MKCIMSLFTRFPPTLVLGGQPSDRALLMSYVVVAMKLVYGFNDAVRSKAFDKRNEFYKKLPHSSLNAWLRERLVLVQTERKKVPSSLRFVPRTDRVQTCLN